ncbi:MAG: hypothetical protein WDO73_36460 [Ignavibacteriota bacterium]
MAGGAGDCASCAQAKQGRNIANTKEAFSLPKAVRSGALAIIYSVSASVFGGTTQFAIKALTDLTGNPLTPAWYLTGAVIVGGIAMVLMQETAPVKARFTAGD